jgi:amino acid adenylation domain-containing protein/non-ribosomal peptide synthase protein (TIGR01720 family)
LSEATGFTMLQQLEDSSGPEFAYDQMKPAAERRLSAPQLGIWLDCEINPAASNYNVSEYLEIFGAVNAGVFEQALRHVVKEVEALNVRFVVRPDGPRQIQESLTDWPMPVVDLSASPNPDADAAAWMQADVARQIDPLRGPLFTYALLRVAHDRWFWYRRYHHIVMDGFGAALSVQRLAHVYSAFMRGDSPGATPFGSLVEMLDEDDAYRRSSHFIRDKAYWSNRLADCPEPASLSAAAWCRSARPIRRTAFLAGPQVQALRAFAKRNRISLPQVITAATAAYMHRMTGEGDLVLGCSVSGRLGLLASRTPGMASNVVPIRLTMRSGLPFGELAEQTARRLREALRYQRYQIANIRRDAGRVDRPIYGVLVNVMPFDYDLRFADAPAVAHNLALGPVDDLGITIYDRSDGGNLRIDFNANPLRYGADEIDVHQKRFLGFLAAIVDPELTNDSATCIGELPLLTVGERRQVVEEWNATAAAYSHDKCLHELIAEQVLRAPDAVAVVVENRELTYAELDRRANQLAQHLRALGVGPDVVVGLYLERSFEMVVGLVGILKAGGAYLPLDPEYPPDRLAFMLSDARAPVLVTVGGLADDLPAHDARVVRLDADWPQVAVMPATALEAGAGPDNLAYVIYTSGSTGKPKGVMNEHGAVVNRLCWMQAEYGLSPLDSVLQKTPFTFDVSVWEFLWPLMQGARLVMARPAGHKDPSYLVDLICRQDITTLHFVPSMLQVFLQEPDVQRCVSIKRVICSGEALSGALQAEFFKRLDTELHNLYGPTEAAIDVTYWACGRDDAAISVPIGRPIWNTQIFILNESLSPVPIGVAGELHIGGVGVARGYIGRADLTAERFIASPFDPDRRLYRTGDLARWRADGVIEYLGRIDHQVKIRGFRIELGEIEAALKQHGGVRDAAVVVREDVPGDKRLVAYVVGAEGVQVSAAELRGLLKRDLPDYMVPSAFVAMAGLPLSHNGKLDRKALPAPDLDAVRSDTAYVAPRNPVETALAAIWEEVLRIKRVGVLDKFFDIGGDSILSLLVVSRANRAGLRITPNQIFQHPTVAGLAAVAETIDRAVATNAPVSGPVPLTAIQSWFFEQELPDPHHWNQAVFLRVEAGLDAALVERALQVLVDHHDALRLRFSREASGWSQVNRGLGETVSLSRIDLSGCGEADREQVMHQAAADLNARLDLADGPLIRAAWFDLGGQQAAQMLIVIHHLAVDGVSWRILLEDLQTACERLRRGEAVELAAKTTSFKQWAERIGAYARSGALQEELPHWHATSSAACRHVPVDFPGGSNTEASARVVSVSLDAEETRALLQQVPSVYHTKINDVLLAALAATLTRWCGGPDIVIDLEGHGREELPEGLDVSRTVGWFTALFPVRLDLGGVAGPGEQLKSIKEQLRAVPGQGLGYGLLRYLGGDAQVAAQLRAAPTPDVAFNYLGQFDQSLPPGSLLSLLAQAAGPTHSPRARRPHVIEIDGLIAGTRLRFDWSYSESLHRRDSVQQQAQAFLEALRALIRHCLCAEAGGFTPSDFPEANLSQHDLDRLISEIG